MATLYLVSTPIGNLGDLTRRAGDILGSVDRILAEDTRRTRILLNHLGLSTPLVSLHAHNEASRAQAVVDWLDAGEALALVSDAGTPLVSDPGSRIVPAVLESGHQVVPIPGPSSILTALVASGLPAERFSFLGFPPRKGRARAELLERMAASPDTMVLFESPERLRALLDTLLELLGPNRLAAVGRELTKIHEEFTRGTLSEISERFRDRAPRGEITLVVAGAPDAGPDAAVDEAAAGALASALLEEGLSPSRAARDMAVRLKIPRNLAYRVVQDLTGEQPRGDREGASGSPREKEEVE